MFADNYFTDLRFLKVKGVIGFHKAPKNNDLQPSKVKCNGKHIRNFKLLTAEWYKHMSLPSLTYM